MFIVLLSYKKPLSEVEKYIAPHIDLLNSLYAEGKIIFSGRKNPRTGGFIVFRNVNKDEVMEIIAKDPFYQNGIADYDVTEVVPTKYDSGFAQYVE